MNSNNAAHPRSATASSAKQTSLLVLLVKRIFGKKKKPASSIYPLR
ncbi:MAG: hypothetical protein JWP80_2517 [Pseudomonas sp.]|nr:hypothetical protein [Pseudomonas sp.]